MSYYKENFKEVKRVGNGYFSTVFESYSLLDDNIYAIKKIPFKPEKMKETEKEIILLNQLNSKFVVHYTHSWIESNYYIGKINAELDQRSLLFDPNLTLLLHIQMEFCQMTLRDFIAKNCKGSVKNSTTLDQYSITCDIFEKLLNGIQYLHTHRPIIIHRDIKPENIMISVIDSEWFLKLADFGLSTFHTFVDESHTKYVGTVQYRAPELIDNKYDTKADIYSLGIIIKELFNFDLNSDNIDVDEKIINHYTYLKEICVNCAAVKTHDRPNCHYILVNKKSWYYPYDEVDYHNNNIIDQNMSTEVVNKMTIKHSHSTESLEDSHLSNGRFKKEYICNIDKDLIVDDGEFSKVYNAKHRLEEHNYAIKMRKYTRSDETKTELEKEQEKRLLREIKVNAKIKHDFLLQYKSYWFESDRKVVKLYIQMELCAMDLKNVVNMSDKITPNIMHLFVITNIFKEIVMGVQYLHSHNPIILHRDLKPGNILLTNGENGKFIKIADFGFAKFYETDQNSSSINTSTDYTAPEVRTGNYDIKADIFSLGMVLAKISNCLLKNNKADTDRQLFDSKLNKLKLLKSRMIDHTAKVRPTCEDILSDKSWILTELEAKNIGKFKPFIGNTNEVNVYDINKTFFEYFTFEKLKYSKSATNQSFFSKIFGFQQ